RRPVGIVIARIVMQRLFRTAVIDAVALFVAGKAGRRDGPGSRKRRLGNGAWRLPGTERLRLAGVEMAYFQRHDPVLQAGTLQPSAVHASSATEPDSCCPAPISPTRAA